MENNIIAFTGRKRSGKDFYCKILTELYGATRMSFSDELKRLARVIYPWIPFSIDDDKKEEKIESEFNIYGFTPREIWLELGGAEGLRYIDPSVFVNHFIANQYDTAVEHPDKLHVITDLRTKQEYDFIKKLGIPIVRITLDPKKRCELILVEDAVEDFISEMKADVDFVNIWNDDLNTQRFIRSLEECETTKFLKKFRR